MKPGKLIIICLAAMTVCSQMDARPKWNPFRKHRKEAVEAPAPKPKKTPLEKFLSKKNLECTGDEIKLYKDGKNLFLEIPDSLKGRTVMLSRLRHTLPEVQMSVRSRRPSNWISPTRWFS